MPTADKVLSVLADVTEFGDVQKNLDLDLYDLHLLDSMKTIELILALEESFGITISPAELERETWATPRKIVEYLETRITRR